MQHLQGGGSSVSGETAAPGDEEQGTGLAARLGGKPLDTGGLPLEAAGAPGGVSVDRVSTLAPRLLPLHLRRFGLRRHRYSLISVATVLGLLALWVVVTTLGLASPRVLPSPTQLITELGVLLAEGYAGKPLWVHVGASALRTTSGFLLGLAVGIPIGLLIGTSRIISSVLSPIFAALRPIPAIAFIPLFIIFFGIGEPPKIFLIFLVTLYYVVLNTSAGVRLVPRILLQAGANQGLSGRQLFTDVIIPAALPQIFTGIKTAAALSWGLVVAAELIAAQEGLGYLISDAGTFFRIPDVYLGILIIGAIGLLLESVIVAVENRVLHWRGK
jgi:ABC-type nitrate/sulfonate/bicarbonate transport system permease component